MNYEYTEYSPGPNLSEYIEYYWTLKLDKPCQAEIEHFRIPDCSPEWIFSTSTGNNGRDRGVIDSFIIPRFKESRIIGCERKTDLFAIRFRPFGLSAVCDINMRKLNGYSGIILPSLLFPGIKNELEGIVALGGPVSEILASIERFLNGIVARNRTVDRAIREAVAAISAKNGDISIGKLCLLCNVSKTTMHNKFLDFIGLSPKDLARIYRLNHFLICGLREQDRSFAKLALDCGYYDQSHLNRDFKSLTGTTPTRFFRHSTSIIVRN